MDSRIRVLFISTLFILQCGISTSRGHRYNTNIDFLLHEAGGITSAPKRDYSAEYPSLKPSSTTLQQTRTTQGLNIVTGTTPKPQSPKRDYVAPQLPTTKHDQKTTSPQHKVTPSPAIHSGPAVKPPSSPKRDYVAPQFPTLKPPQDNNRPTGNVKDLINYYDNFKNNNNNNNNARKPSYSSILQGTSLGTTVKPSITPKLPSFSSVVGGTTKLPSPPTTPLVHKPTVPNSGKNTPATVPVLPSTILNNKNQGSSASNIATDAELQAISEELLKKDTNNAARYVTINFQEKTSSSSKEDKASQPLLNVASDVWNIPTIQKFLPLLDNYERDTLVNEYVTSQERTEENAFMDAIMSTSVIRHLMNFLKEKGKVPADPAKQRDFLKQIWFGLYSRGKGKISSSGFEHVFVSELKNGEVSGLHNWIYFSKEESANRVNYLGYLKYVQLNDKGVVMKLHFNQQGVDKPVDSMFIGTSPELEIALYTLCFVTREGDDCILKLANKDVNILTHNFRYRSKNYIGSAFPQI